MSVESATELARTTPTWGTASWWQLEARLFRDHSQIRSLIGSMAPASERTHFVRGRTPWWAPLIALIQLATMVLPPVAVVLLVSRHVQRPDGPRFLPAAIVATVALVIGIFGLVNLVRNRHRTATRPMRMTGWCHAIAGALLTFFAIRALLTHASPDVAGWMVIVFGLEVLIGILFLALMPKPKNALEAQIKLLEAQRVHALAMLTEQEQRDVRTELSDAVGILHERQLIDAHTARSARAAPLGRLADLMTHADGSRR